MKRIFAALAFVTACMLFLSLVLVIPITGQQEEPDPQPSAEQNTFYMKGNSDGSTIWMDANPDMNDSAASHDLSYLGNGEITEQYDQDPPLDRELIFEDNGTLIIHLHLQRSDSGAHSTGVHLRLRAGGETLFDGDVTSNDEANWHWEGPIPVGMVNSTDNFIFTWSYTFTGNGACTMYTDGSSYITLPIVGDSDGDGQDDVDDDDDDGDGYTDEEEIEAGTDPKDPNDHPSTAPKGKSDDSDDDELDMAVVGGVGVVVVLIVLAVVYIKIIKPKQEAAALEDDDEESEEDESEEEEGDEGEEEEEV